MTNNLIRTFNSELIRQTTTNHIELEIRVDIDKNEYARVRNQIKFDVSELSINFISGSILNRPIATGDSQYIRKLVFVGTTKTSEQFYEKKRLIQPVSVVGNVPHRVSVGAEKTIGKFTTQLGALVRFKIRYSKEHVFNGKRWMIDLTAVYADTFSKIRDNVVELKDKLFANTDTKAVLAQPLISSYELEVEYVDTQPLDAADLEVINDIYVSIDPNFRSKNAFSADLEFIATKLNLQNPKHHGTVGARSVKQMTNQVIALTKNAYFRDVFPPIGYYVTEKADGVRALVMCYKNRCAVLSNELVEFINETVMMDEITIVDAEWLSIDKTIYIFDVLMIKNKNVLELPFKDRIQFADVAVAVINSYGAVAVKKNFVVVEEKTMKKSFEEIAARKYEYEIDGLILTAPDASYAETKNYKWKPLKNNTIDFYAKKVAKKKLFLEDREGHDLYVLFVGISRVMMTKLGITHLSIYKELITVAPDANYFPVHFCPSSNPSAFIYYAPISTGDLDGKIIELKLDERNQWEFVRVRTDREATGNYFGNDFKIAEITYSNYIDEFKLSDLYTAGSNYFKNVAEDTYKESNKYRRIVIGNLIKKYFSNKKTIIDEGSGRGADLHRYVMNGIKNVLFIDIDATAISELISRKYEFMAQKFNRNLKEVATSIYALVSDLNLDASVQLAKIDEFKLDKADGSICNFAFHYMCENVKGLKNILQLNYSLLLPNGYFIITVFSGEKVFELLRDKKVGEAWTVVENNRVKYSLTRKYLGDTMSDAGQKISVLLPFADEPYDEYLVNLSAVKTISEQMGFRMIVNKSFMDYSSEVGTTTMTEGDKTYAGLYHTVVLQKIS